MIINSIILELISIFVPSMIYKIPRILRYDLDYGSLSGWMLFEFKVEVFDVVLNHIEIRRRHDFVGYNNKAIMVNLDKIDDIVIFDALKSMIETSDMFT